MFVKLYVLVVVLVISNSVAAIDIRVISSSGTVVSFAVNGDYALGDNDSPKQARVILLDKIKRTTADNYGQLVESSRGWRNQAVTSSTVSMLSAEILNVRNLKESVSVDESGRILISIDAVIDIDSDSLQSKVDELRGVRLEHLAELRDKQSISYAQLSEMRENLKVVLRKTADLPLDDKSLSERRKMLDHLETVNSHLSAISPQESGGYLEQVNEVKAKAKKIAEGTFSRAIEDYELNHFKLLSMENDALRYSAKITLTPHVDGTFELTALLGWTTNALVYSFDNRHYFDSKTEIMNGGSRGYSANYFKGLNKKTSYNDNLIKHFKGRNVYVIFEYGTHHFEYVFSKGASFNQHMYDHRGQQTDVFGKSNFIRITGLTESDITNNGKIKGRVEVRNESS